MTVSGLTLTGTAAGNYTLTQPSGLTANITKVGVTITSGITANNKPYDGTTTATISSNNVVLSGVLAGDTGNVFVSTNGYTANFASAAAGNGIAVTVSGLTLTGTAAGNYTLTQPSGLTANITKVGVTITSGITANNKPYDGTTTATISSNNVVLAGILAGDVGNVNLVTNGYTANFASAAAGNGIAVTVSGLTLTGTAAGNYTLTQPSGLTANITKVGVTITSGITANNKPYDGTTTATISSNNVVLAGILAGDVGNVNLVTNGYTANFASAAAGNGIAVTVSGLTLTGTAAGNYTLTQPSGLTANITKVGVTITSGITANNKPYDGTTTATISSNNVVLAGILAGDVGNVALATNGYTANFASTAAGNGIAVTVSGLTLTGTAAGNYTLTQPSGLTANITKVGVTITSGITANNKPYDGTTTATISSNNVILAGVLGGDTGNVFVSTNGYTANFASAAAGNGIAVTVSGLTLTGTAAGNYTLTQPSGLTANITKVGVTITSGITANNKPYDGTTTATISSNNVVLAGILAGDVGNVNLVTNGYTANFASAAAGNGIAVTVSGLTLTGTAAGNYTLTQPSGLTANITKVGVTITSGITANNKPYDGTTTATISSNNVVLGGVLAGDTANVFVSTNGYTANFASAAAGNGIAVTVSGLTLTGTAAGNYTLTQPSGLTANITKVGVTITSGITANNKPYDGTTTATISSNNVVLAGILAGDVGNVDLVTNGYTANFASAAAGNGIAVTVSGLTLTGTAAGNYTLTQPSGLTANITKVGVTITSGITANNKPYDGTTTATISSNNVVLSGVLAGDTANVFVSTNGYTANFASAAAGNGIAVTVSGLTLTGTAAGNYTLTQPSGLTANITKVGVTITSGITANNKPYDGTTTATISSNNVVLAGVLAGDVGNVNLVTNGYTANFASAAAGNGIAVTVSGLTLTGTAAGNYTLTQPSGLTANITKVGVTITSGITANNKPYDGTTTATISSNNVVLGGVLAGDTANVFVSTNGYTANFASAAAGNGIAVTVSGLTLTGTAAGNYTLTQPSGLTANITKVGVTITSGITANNKPYDGTTTATISSNNVVLAGILAGDVGNVNLVTNGYTANFASAAAGNGIAVTVSGLTLTGTAAGNYTLTQPSGLTANITKVGVTITSGITANNKPYDGTTTATISSNNVVLSGVLAGDTANVFVSTNGYTANFASATAGNGIAVTVSGLTLTGTAAGNYTLTQPSGLTANITKVGVTITSGITANNKPYDGTTTATISSNNVVLAGVLAGDTGNVFVSTNGYTANFASATAGNGIAVTVSGLTLTGTAAGNYTLTQPSGLTANITKVGVTITSGITANNKPYDGTTTATITSNNVVLSGVLAGDTANVRISTNGYTANFASAAAGNGIAVTVSGLTLTGTAAGNYTLTQPSGLTANITKVGVTITSGITANNKPYDGTTTATISSNNVVLAGVLGGDTGNVFVSTNGYTANFASTAAGNGIAVTVSGLTLTGTAAGNYTLTQPSGLTANITKVGVTITSGITANNKPYDGTTTATISSNNVVLAGVLAGDTGNVFVSTNGYTANFASATAGNGIAVTVSGLTLTGTAAGNYTLTQPSGLTANITKVGVTITSGITANNKPYDGTTTATITSNNVVLSGVLAGDTANVRISTNGYTANFASAAAGNGIGVTVSGLTLTGTAAGNYTLTQPSGLTANITKVGVTITSGITANNKPYDGTTTATISSNNVVLAGVLAGDTGNVSLVTNGYVANFASANVGNGISVTVSGLTLTGTAAGNYSLSQPAGLTANITKVGVTITSGITANNKPYDGTTTATISSNNVMLAGVLAGDTGNVFVSTNGYTANFASTAAGNGIAVTVSGLTLTGTAAGNYTLTQPSGLTANITKVGVTITSGITANNKPYDGTTTATITSNNVVLSGVLAGDTANVRISTNGYTANFASAAAGNGIGVTVSGLTLTGTAAGNYTLTQPSGLTANITKVGVTITSGITANNKPYDGTTTATISSNNVVLAGVLAGDTGNVSLVTNGYVANFASANVGNGISVTVSGLTLTGTAAGNYSLSQPAGLTANITKVGVTITSGITANNKPYDGTTTATISSNNVVLAGVLAGDTGNVFVSTNGYTANFASATAGNGIAVTVSGLTLTGTAAGNYTLTQPSGLTANITKVGVTITSGITANNKPYDGTTTATINSNNVILAGVLAGDTANVRISTIGYTATFASANAGNGIAVTVSGLTLTGTAAGNYTLTQPSGLTANITKAGVTITSGLTANDKPYDGTTTATITSNNVVLSGVLAGDTANVRISTIGYTATFASANAGNGIAVTVSGLTLTGSASGNYILSQPAGLSANITPKVLTIGSATVSPVITSICLTNGIVTIKWNSVTGGIYRVQYNSNLSGSGWADLSPDVTATNSTATQTNAVGGVLQRFYRVELLNAGLTANDKVYDGTTAATLSSNNVILVGVVNGDSVSLVTNGYTANFATANVGTGIPVTVSGLTLSGSAAGNYNLSQPTGLTANITKAGVTISSGISANNKVYDGTTTATISSNNMVLVGVLAGDTGNVFVSINGYTANFASPGVGHGIGVTVSGLTLTGSAAGNYNLSQPTGLTANITKAGVTISSGLSANNKVYDGTTTATISSNNMILAGISAGDTGNVGLSTNGYVANFASAGVGNGIGVTVSELTLTGSAAGNYNLSQPAGLTANITPKALTIGSALPAPVITSICLTNGVVTIKWSSVTGGIYRVQYNSSLSASGWADLSPDVMATNSTATQTNAVGGVQQRFYRVKLLNAGLTANDKVYDGTTAATLSSNNVTLVGVVNGDSVSLVTNGYTANFATADAGTGIPVSVSGLTLSGPSAGNYALTQPVGLTANITGKVITILSVPPPVITSICLTNGVATIKWSSVTGGIYRVQYDSSLNGNGWADLSPDVTATNSTATQTNTVGGAAQRFYRIKVLNSGITANNKMYDGTTTATLSSNNVTLLGLAAGDMVSLSTNGYTASFATPNVGTAIPVTVSGLTLTGANAADYTLVQPAGLTANITPATLTVSAVNNSKIYGLPNPSLTASYSGFVNSEGPGVLNGAPSLITGATINSPPGSYNIQAGVGTLIAANYVFDFVDGTLSVVGAPQLSSVFMSGNQLALSWPTITSETYQLEYKDNLAAPTWTPIPGSIPGTGTQIIVTNNLGASPQRFFRLVINNYP